MTCSFIILLFRSETIKIKFYELVDTKLANEMIIQSGILKLSYHPDVEKYVEGKKSDEVFKEFKELFRKGRRRFEYEDLLNWKKVMLELYQISEEVCAKVFLGRLEKSNLYDYILQLDSHYVEIWMDLMSKSIIYEISRSEFFPANKKKFDEGVEVIAKSLDQELKTQFRKTQLTIRFATDKSVCRFAKTLYNNSHLLSPELEEEFLKFLVASDE